MSIPQEYIIDSLDKFRVQIEAAGGTLLSEDEEGIVRLKKPLWMRVNEPNGHGTEAKLVLGYKDTAQNKVIVHPFAASPRLLWRGGVSRNEHHKACCPLAYNQTNDYKQHPRTKALSHMRALEITADNLRKQAEDLDEQVEEMKKLMCDIPCYPQALEAPWQQDEE